MEIGEYNKVVEQQQTNMARLDSLIKEMDDRQKALSIAISATAIVFCIAIGAAILFSVGV